jgi:hypothetical protein
MTVFMTPDQVPFFGGTYFPPNDQHGRPGFKRLLASIAQLYRTRRSDLEKDRERILQSLEEAAQLDLKDSDLTPDLLDAAYRSLLQHFDSRHGGFGGAPKFPSTMALAFLLRYSRRCHSDPALDMVNVSLTEMARGGIYDQLGGGFHRYSVDERWLVPHFEKMLYDNALLARLYLEAYQVTGNRYYRKIVEETLGYVQREMLDAAGGFYSSQDADSEGEEGKFFVWRPEELVAVLGKEEAQLFGEYFDVTTLGNFEGQSILHHRTEVAAYSKITGIPVEKLEATFAQARSKLLAARENRVKPGRDEKVLAAWNGMMLTAFAEAAFAFGDRRLLDIARQNAAFLLSKLFVNGRLLRSWKQGEAKLNGYLEDYAQVIAGLLATYAASGEIRWLEAARNLMELQLQKFRDPGVGDFYFTSSDHEALLVRQKEYFDNATPSGNSVSCSNLLKLSVLLGEKKYREIAEQMLRRMSTALGGYASALGCWLQALDFFFGPVQEIAIVGPAGTQREKLVRPLRERFLPNKIVTLAEEVSLSDAAQIPLLVGKISCDGKPTAYVCRDYACQRPVTDAEALEVLL